MYAIVENGGKQYKVEKDQLVSIEYNKAEVGSKIDLNCIMVADGEKVVTGKAAAKASVKAEVVSQDRKSVV